MQPTPERDSLLFKTLMEKMGSKAITDLVQSFSGPLNDSSKKGIHQDRIHGGY